MLRSGRTRCTAITCSCTGSLLTCSAWDAPPAGRTSSASTTSNGLENPTENFANICGWLVQHGFADDAIRAVLGGNIYRALQSVWVG